MEPNIKTLVESENQLTEKELTDKFLSGELSFTEYSERWSGITYPEDEDGEADPEVEREPEVEEDIEISTENDSDRWVGEKKVRIRRRRQLPLALAGLMGEANLRYARGDREMAEKMCYEIIRQIPTASEPFQTLAQIYESDPDKSLQFSLIAAHLNPSDAEQWIRLAVLSKEKGDMKQCIFCYTKAINANPKHIPYHLSRLEVMKALEEKGTIAPRNLSSQVCYVRLMGYYPDSEGQTVLNIAKMIAQDYHSNNEIRKACYAMTKAYKRFPDLFTFEDLNLYLELLITLKEYDKCQEIFIARCGIEIETEVIMPVEGEVNETDVQIVNCSLPPDLPIDIRTKLIVCLIHMKAFDLVNTFLDNMIENEDVENTGDIFLDIEEALTSEQYHTSSLRLLKILVASERYSLPAVWLKYAECLSILNMKTEAIDAYKHVVQLAPQHLDARIKLSALLKDMNRIEEALIALEQDIDASVVDIGLLYERYVILKCKGEYDLYFKLGRVLLSRHFFTIRHRDEVNAFRIKDTVDSLKLIREARGEDFEDHNLPVFLESTNQLSLEVEWSILNDLFVVADKLGDYSTLERIAFSALGSKRFQEYRNSLEFMCFLACLYNSDYFYGFNMIRDFVVKMPDKIGVWNSLNLIIQRVDGKRHSKFLMRYLNRQTDLNKMTNLIWGNSCLMSGTYKCALKEYIRCFKSKNDSLAALLAGITLIHMASQKFAVNRHTLITHALAFFSYYEKLRGSDGAQEIYYNMGRAYHQLGLVYLASQYYKRALECDIALPGTDDNILDLRKEIAFNLYLIYKKDAPEVANMYLEKYIVI